MTVLVTGATGGFGSLLANWLQVSSNEPIWRTGRVCLDDAHYYSCDLMDARKTCSLIAKLRPRSIFHLAGDFSNEGGLDCSINVLGAKHIIEALIDNNIKARVLLVGSAAEYGVVSPRDNPINENHVLRPVSIYGLTKAFQTQIGIYYSKNFDVEIVIARMFNLLAPGLSDRLFVGNVERQIAAYLRKEIKQIVVGNLDSQRDYVSADQAIEQINLIMTKGKSGEIYHVASGKPVCMRKLLHNLLDDAGIKFTDVKENDQSIENKRYDVPVIFADLTKTNNLHNV